MGKLSSKLVLSAVITSVAAMGAVSKVVFADDKPAAEAGKDGCNGKDGCKGKDKAKHHKDKDGCKGKKDGCKGHGKKKAEEHKEEHKAE